ncbi:homeobox-leucine zipper protein MERISTEM L1-like [Malania oleifera]|uniref:homeobox-leucine zipper protein MERISTEM L1-like n=1 Tax=Malania oleifera TaxID=397392 RepID=UPI0025AE32ED|nr:homeobox-leucine zipper protein MERISTEM L1-like [Malania oleifera]XP_057950846.1 homeobox-leucine zipper protein MERISTEM L1-like [Malania oleifera]XP_057950850.1 homeobox-leucine zipper protein MERISTEM L1-like [Malania oleifera]
MVRGMENVGDDSELESTASGARTGYYDAEFDFRETECSSTELDSSSSTDDEDDDDDDSSGFSSTDEESTMDSSSVSDDNMDSEQGSISQDLPHPPQHSPNRVSNFESYAPSDDEDNEVYHRASDLLMSVIVCADVNHGKIIDHAIAAMDEFITRAAEWEYSLDKRPQVDRNSWILQGECSQEFRPLKAALEEITKMVEVGEPRSLPSLDNSTDYIGETEYNLTDTVSSTQILQDPFQTEFSQETAIVPINPIALVEILTNSNQWSFVFADIVSRAVTLGVLSRGAAGNNLNGAIQVMMAEFHVPSPLVPTRECHFVRYSKQLNYVTWAVADVSLESLFPSPVVQYRRKPSGCLIQAMQNGCSKIIWIEHGEADNTYVPLMFRPLVSSGFAFCARRWVASLVRQCEHLEAVVVDSDTRFHHGGSIPHLGRKSLLKLGERMIRTFCVNISAARKNQWLLMHVPGTENIRINIKKNTSDPGRPLGVALIIVTSFSLPAPPRTVFNFLHDARFRTEWDILLFGHCVREVMNIHTGSDPGTHLSVQEDNAGNGRTPMLYLQEAFIDMTGSYIVYAPVEMFSMATILNGGSSDSMPILPSGFAVLPDRPNLNGENSQGSILTVAFDVLDEASTEDHIPSRSVEIIYNLIFKTVHLIKSTLVSEDQQNE